VAPSLLAADSATPRADGRYGDAVRDTEAPSFWPRAWGVYVGGAAVHVWTRAEAAGLHPAGIEAAFPIVVPPQTWPWIVPEDEVMVDLVREAEAWGVARGGPLIIDLEQWQAERMGSQLPSVLDLFGGVARAAGFTPVAYGGASVVAAAGSVGVGRFLARWARAAGSPPPERPELPAGLFGWQYAGNVPDPFGAIDLDLLALPAVLMATDFSVASGLVTISKEGDVAPVLTPRKPAAPAPEPVAEALEPTPEEIAATVPAAPPEAPAAAAVPDGVPVGQTPAEADALAGVTTEPAAETPTETDRNFVQLLAVGDGEAYADVCAVGDGYYALTYGGRVEAVRLIHYGEPGPRVGTTVAIAATPSGRGYYVLTAQGRVYHYGDAGTAKAAETEGGSEDART